MSKKNWQGTSSSHFHRNEENCMKLLISKPIHLTVSRTLILRYLHILYIDGICADIITLYISSMGRHTNSIYWTLTLTSRLLWIVHTLFHWGLTDRCIWVCVCLNARLGFQNANNTELALISLVFSQRLGSQVSKSGPIQFFFQFISPAWPFHKSLSGRVTQIFASSMLMDGPGNLLLWNSLRLSLLESSCSVVWVAFFFLLFSNTHGKNISNT